MIICQLVHLLLLAIKELQWIFVKRSEAQDG